MTRRRRTHARAWERAAARGQGRRGFTLVELIIVIAVIGVLVTAVAMIGTRVLRSHKAEVTRGIMRNVHLAIDQFKEENPLRQVYGRVDGRYQNGAMARPTFGPFPPYQLTNAGAQNSVALALENGHPLVPNPGFPGSLEERIARDLSGVAQSGLNYQNWVKLGAQDRRNDDNRALGAYLKVYAPRLLEQVPDAARKPLNTGLADFVNSSGRGTAPGSQGLTDVQGFVDAWGIPMDYFLYVKLEVRPRTDGVAGNEWYVADRIPALRSLGGTVSREEHEAGATGDPTKWIFSAEFPSPEANGPYVSMTDPRRANFRIDGIINQTGTRGNGWARAVGDGDYDPNQPVNERFGFLP